MQPRFCVQKLCFPFFLVFLRSVFFFEVTCQHGGEVVMWLHFLGHPARNAKTVYFTRWRIKARYCFGFEPFFSKESVNFFFAFPHVLHASVVMWDWAENIKMRNFFSPIEEAINQSKGSSFSPQPLKKLVGRNWSVFGPWRRSLAQFLRSLMQFFWARSTSAPASGAHSQVSLMLLSLNSTPESPETNKTTRANGPDTFLLFFKFSCQLLPFWSPLSLP